MKRWEDREAKDFSRRKSDCVSKGAVNLAEVGTTSCKSRTALNACKDRVNALGQATTGVMVKHACRLARTLNSALEASVWITEPANSRRIRSVIGLAYF